LLFKHATHALPESSLAVRSIVYARSDLLGWKGRKVRGPIGLKRNNADELVSSTMAIKQVGEIW
jgi:hypothetical protein